MVHILLSLPALPLACTSRGQRQEVGSAKTDRPRAGKGLGHGVGDRAMVQLRGGHGLLLTKHDSHHGNIFSASMVV